MSMDTVHNEKVVPAIVPATITGTTTGLVIDTAGFESLTFDINVGAFNTFTDTDKWTFTVEEGDVSPNNTTLSDAAAIAAADYLGAYKEGTPGWDKILDGATDDGAAFSIGVRINTKRYKRIILTEGGTVSCIGSVTAKLGHPRHLPVGDTH